MPSRHCLKIHNCETSKELGGTNAQGDPIVDDSLTNNLPEVHDVIRRMRAMVASYPGDRVLIGETYLPNTAAVGQVVWRQPRRMNCNCPWICLVGLPRRSRQAERNHLPCALEEVETQIHGSVSHSSSSTITTTCARSIATATASITTASLNSSRTVLLTTHATALMYYGEELGMPTTTPTRKEDVKDPIGITGWPKEKGRDGERTPMQWTAGSAGRIQHRSAHLAADSAKLQDNQRRRGNQPA